MINNRVAFTSALALAVLSLFLVGGSEASLNFGEYAPSDSTRLDPSAGMSFNVTLDASGDLDEGITSIVAAFGDPDGSWSSDVTENQNLYCVKTATLFRSALQSGLLHRVCAG